MSSVNKELNPFLCDDCQKLGYCKKVNDRANYKVSERLVERSNKKTNTEINNSLESYLDSRKIIGGLENVLPIKTTVLPGLYNKMQNAHNALREDDYETAYLHYKAIVSDGYFHWEAYLGLTLCCYYLGDYDKAIEFLQRINIEDKAIDAFIQHCIDLSIANNTICKTPVSESVIPAI